MARQLSDKDRKLLVNLKEEIQTYTLQATAGAGAGSGAGVNGARATPPPVPALPGRGGSSPRLMEVGLPRGDSPVSPISAMRRKAPPVSMGLRDGDGNGSGSGWGKEVIEMIGVVFGVRRDVWEGDLAELSEGESLEEVSEEGLLVLHRRNSFALYSVVACNVTKADAVVVPYRPGFIAIAH